MSLEITGTLEQKSDTVQVSDKFKKREFVVAIQEEINGNMYTNYGKFQLVQNKCDIIDRFRVGDQVKVNFNIKGNKWEKDGKINFITNLDAWRIEAIGNNQQPQNQNIPVHSSGHTTNGGTGYASSSPVQNNTGYSSAPNFTPSPETIDDLPF